jgi:Arc/MetJ-type ribon-helix-helix transcriptional regulator
MTVLKPRSRSISVRLSEEEFLAFQQVCVSTGARSVSDFARKAMQDILERMEAKRRPKMKESEYTAQLAILEQRVAELATELAMFRARQTAGEAEN